MTADYGDWVPFTTPIGQKFIFATDIEDIYAILQTESKSFVKGKAVELFKLLIGEGLPVADGEKWKILRKVSQPFFFQKQMEAYSQVMVETTQEHLERWADKGDIEFKDAVAELTHDIVARNLFGADLGDKLHDMQRAWVEAADFMVDRSTQIVRLPLSFPLDKHVKFRKAMEVVNGTVDDIIRSRQGLQTEERYDLLSRLIENKELDEKTIRDQILAYLFAGHETTANNIGWTMHEILRHPEVEKKIRAEITEKMPPGQPVTMETLSSLVYLKQVIYESLRLFPPASIFVREAAEDIEIRGKKMKKGNIVFIAPLVVQRKAEYWENPEEFDPDRFENFTKKRGPNRFLAFGAGQRVCIGEQFAILEAQAVLGLCFQQFEFKSLMDKPAEMVFKGTLQPSSVRLNIKRS